MSGSPTGKFNVTDFHPGVIPNGFKQDAKKFIELCVLLGWELTVHDGNQVTLTSKHTFPPQVIRLNTRTKSNDFKGALLRRAARFADPSRVEDVLDVVEGKMPDNVLTMLANKVEPVKDARKPKTEAKPAPPKPKPPKKVPTPEKVAEKVAQERHILVRRPLLARYTRGRGNNPGRSYPSQTTIERLWSDGTQDYQCALSTCTDGEDGGPYTADDPLSIRSHWGKHVRAGEAERFDQSTRGENAVDDPTYGEDAPRAWEHGYTPRRVRVNALAAFLRGLGPLADLTPEKVAEAALKWCHEQSAQGSDMAAEREELSPEDIIVRISRLVERGRYSEQQAQITDLTQQIADLSERVALAEQARTDAEADAKKAQSVLRAFTEMASEYAKEDQP